MSRMLITVSLCIYVLTGCMSSKAVLFNPSDVRYSPVEPKQVRILTSVAELDGYEYVHIAMISSSASAEFTSKMEMIESIRKKAGEMGANAILLPDIHEPSDVAQIAGAVFGTGTSRRGEAVAYRIIGEKAK